MKIIFFCFSAAQFYEITFYTIDELLNDITVYLEAPFEGKSKLQIGQTNFTSLCGQSVYRHTEYYFNGRCYSFLMPSCLLENGILEMVFNFKEKGEDY